MKSKFFKLGLAASLIVIGLAIQSVLISAQQPEKSPSAPAAKTSSTARTSHQSSTAATEDTSLPTQTEISQGTKIDAVLESTLDAQQAKPGQEVTAKVTKNVKEHGKVVIHKGDELVGRITTVQAGATAKGASQLAVTFDRLVQGNATSQLNAVVSAVLSTPNSERGSSMEMMQPEPMMGSAPGAAMPSRSATQSSGGGGGLLGGVAGTANSAVGAVGSVVGGATSTVNSATSTTGSAVTGVGNTVNASTNTHVGNLTGASVATPVRAIHLSSDTQADNNTGVNSVFSTPHGNLRLESGTHLQFKVAAGSEASKSKN